MTGPEMLGRVEKLLDKVATATSFWSIPHIYQGLSDGQREAVNLVLNAYNEKAKANYLHPLPKTLEKLIVYPTAGTDVTTNYVSLPSGFLQELAVKYDYNNSGTYKHLSKREFDKEYFDANSYKSNWTYAITNDKIYFGTSESGTGKYQMVYLQKPTEITAAINPILPDFTHEAICQYCVSEMLKKDTRYDEAKLYFNQFLKLVESFT